MSSAAGKDLATDEAQGPEGHAEFDWRAIEASPEFRELVARKRRFVVPAAIFSLAFFLTYLFLAAFATGLMSSRIGGVSVAWLLAVSQVLMTWAVTWLYLRKSDREWDPLQQRATERATAELRGGPRFVRTGDSRTAAGEVHAR
jgi:uncharacterized membrane protein (DUF485 family)